VAAAVSEGRRSRVVPAARLLLLVLAIGTGWGAVAAAGGTGHASDMILAGPPAAMASAAPAALGPPDDRAGEAPRDAAAGRAGRNAASRSQARLDPRFAGCSKARAAGFGPYQRGLDPEYRWYPDGDGDGVACDGGAAQPVDAGL